MTIERGVTRALFVSSNLKRAPEDVFTSMPKIAG
jgi:hypothetical protein